MAFLDQASHLASLRSPRGEFLRMMGSGDIALLLPMLLLPGGAGCGSVVTVPAWMTGKLTIAAGEACPPLRRNCEAGRSAELLVGSSDVNQDSVLPRALRRGPQVTRLGSVMVSAHRVVGGPQSTFPWISD